MTLSKFNGVRGLYLDVHKETTETQTRTDIFDQQILILKYKMSC